MGHVISRLEVEFPGWPGQQVKIAVEADGVVVIEGARKVITDFPYLEDDSSICLIGGSSNTPKVRVIMDTPRRNGIHISLQCDDRYPWNKSPYLYFGTRRTLPVDSPPEFIITAGRGEDTPDRHFLIQEPLKRSKAA